MCSSADADDPDLNRAAGRAPPHLDETRPIGIKQNLCHAVAAGDRTLPDRRRPLASMALQAVPGTARSSRRRSGLRAVAHCWGKRGVLAHPLGAMRKVLSGLKDPLVAAVDHAMNIRSVPCATRPANRSAGWLPWLLLAGWLTGSGFALASHMLDNPPGVCTTRAS